MSMDTGNRLKEHFANAAMGDRNVMIRQIEAHKTARQVGALCVSLYVESLAYQSAAD